MNLQQLSKGLHQTAYIIVQPNRVKLRLVGGFLFTVDGERGRCLRLAHHVFRHAAVGAYISRDQTTDLQGVVLTYLISS